ncbi:MAG: LCP family protein [Candidatus Eremiobacteraeota bacterium]|nr:LCP family protein [Candidatus Eremiobacteraeota bacterium]
MGKHLLRSKSTTRTPSLGRSIFLALIVGLLVVGGVGGFQAVRTHRTWLQVVEAPIIPAPQDLFGKSRIYVLVMGLDYDYNEKDYEYSKKSRSDTIMAATLDFPTTTLTELSVLRDMGVVLPNGHLAKINQAMSDGGPVEAQAVIAKFLGISGFDRYVVLRVNAAKQLIDTIGGIEVPVKEQMDYDDSWGHLHIHFKPGLHHMNGEQAVSYARFRHDWCGDTCRVERQQQVMRIMLAKLKANKLNDLAHINSFIDVFNRNVDSNLTAQEKLSLANAYSGVDLHQVKTESIPYVDTKDTPFGGNVLIADEGAKRNLVNKLMFGAFGPPDQRALAAIAPSSLKVDVQNGSGRAGSAKQIAARLKSQGFVIGNVGNAPTSDYARTEIHAHTTITFAGEKVRSAMHASHVEVVADSVAAPPPLSDVTVIVGRDLALAQQQASATR